MMSVTYVPNLFVTNRRYYDFSFWSTNILGRYVYKLLTSDLKYIASNQRTYQVQGVQLQLCKHTNI